MQVLTLLWEASRCIGPIRMPAFSTQRPGSLWGCEGGRTPALLDTWFLLPTPLPNRWALPEVRGRASPPPFPNTCVSSPPVSLLSPCCCLPSRPSSSAVDSLLRLRGRLLLDHEALSCLLVLLFVDEPKLNTSRLHRVLRNLCYHAPTRSWVIRSLLSILQRSSESELCLETPKPLLASAAAPLEDKGKRGGAKAGPAPSPEPRPLDLLHKMEAKSSGQLSWLSVSMDAALGCRTNIFQIQRGGGGIGAGGGGGTSGGGGGASGGGGRKHTDRHAPPPGATVHIHPQAAPVVCRHVLDTLIQLAKVSQGGGF